MMTANFHRIGWPEARQTGGWVHHGGTEHTEKRVRKIRDFLRVLCASVVDVVFPIGNPRPTIWWMDLLHQFPVQREATPPPHPAAKILMALTKLKSSPAKS